MAHDRFSDRSGILYTTVVIFLCIPSNGLAIGRNFWDHINKQPDIRANGRTFPETSSLDNHVIDFLSKHHYPGCILGVSGDDGTVLYVQGYGQTNDGGRLHSSSVLPVSSISKLLTAASVMRLVEEGHLTLSDFVFGRGAILGDLVPFPSTGAADQRLFDIRVAHLLHHTSGLQGYSSELNDVRLLRGHRVLNISKEMGLRRHPTLRDVIRYSSGRPLVFAPGREFAYSNLGYAILGEMIENRSGMSYSEYIRREILEPLGMWRTSICPDLQSVQNTPDGDPLDISGSPELRASLGWVSSVPDLLRLMDGLHDMKILSASSLETMMDHPASPVSEHREHWYGMGLHVGNDGSWWQSGDPHTNEVLLYQSGQRAADRGGDRLRWVVLLPNNQHRNLRNDFLKIFEPTAMKWPRRYPGKQMNDFADASFHNNGRHILLNTGTPIGNFKAFTTALLEENFRPMWIDVYQRDGEPLVSSIWRQSKSAPVRHMIDVNISGDGLRKMVDGLLPKRLSLQSFVPYSVNHQRKYVAVFSNDTSGYQRYGWETTDDIYGRNREFFTEELTLTPTAKAVLFDGEREIVSYMFDKLNTTAWAIHDRVAPDDIRSLALTMAKRGKTMIHASSYDILGTVYFSTIFADVVGVNGMQLDVDVDQQSLAARTKIMQGKNLRPRLVSGYNAGGDTKFLILWTRWGLD